MPELPEVETIAEGLRGLVVGERIRDVEWLWPGCLADSSPARFAELVLNRRITSVNRRAKLIRLELADDDSPDVRALLLIHLKMTGRVFVTTDTTPQTPYERVRLGLADGRFLIFHDVRKFGTVRAMLPDELPSWPFYASLGPEPLELPLGDFLARLSSRRGRIKALLLDQRFVAGIGNIYADESLFRARIRPDREASSLETSEIAALHAAFRAVLARAIEAGGSTIRDYRTANGVSGLFQHEFAVYGRGGQACPVCAHPLSVMKVAGRTSTFCEHCQK